MSSTRSKKNTKTTEPKPKRPNKKTVDAALKKQKSVLSDKEKCQYCGKKVNIVSHICTIGLRYLSKDDMVTRMAFRFFQRFYELRMDYRKPVDFSNFAKSTVYSGFILFARYVRDIDPVSPMIFVDFLIKNGVPLRNWTRKTVYDTYLRELNKKETPFAAIERNFLLMQQWERETGEDWRDFFRKIAPAKATLWITTGRISPWILYTAPSAKELMGRMTNEQVKIIEKTIDPEFWLKRIEAESESVDAIVAIMAESGL